MRIIIPGEPLAKSRPRATIRGAHAAVYDSQAKVVQELRSKFSYFCALNKPTDFEAYFRLPLFVTLCFHIGCAQSLSEPKKNEKLWHFCPCIPKDLDNLCKMTLDIGNGILWKDDRQIVQLYAEKKFSDTPCTEIKVSLIKNSMSNVATKITKIFSPAEISLLNVHLCVLRNALSQFESCPLDEKSFMIENVSIELIRFANEYAQKLTKIRDK